MIKVSNDIYKYEHEKCPRGVGQWAFYVPISDKKLTTFDCPFKHYEVTYGNHKYALVWASKVMSLADAKKEIVDWLKSWFLKGTIYVAD